MTNKKYRRHNGQFARRYEGLPMVIGYLFLAVCFWAVLMHLNNKPLVSPVADIATPVYAETISCEDPRGYLECKVYKGEITWEDHEKLSKIIYCESRWDDQAVNVNKDGSIDRGIFQLNSKWHKKISNEESFNFKKNIDYGVKLYKQQGVKPWVCARILNIK